MGLLGNVAQGIRSLFRRQALEREMDDELREFIDASTAEKVRRGMPAKLAAHAARVEMGSINAVKHHIRSATWESRMEIFLRDLKHCFRGLLRSPGFTLIAVLSLALGIGANTAIFTLIKQVLLQNLPVHDPQQLVTFGKSTNGGVLGGIDLGTADMFTYDFARHLEANPGPFQSIAAYTSFARRVSVRVSNSAAALQVPASPVSGNFFQCAWRCTVHGANHCAVRRGDSARQCGRGHQPSFLAAIALLRSRSYRQNHLRQYHALYGDRSDAGGVSRYHAGS